jgi:hypothetical protein
MLQEVDVQARDPRRLRERIGPERAVRFESRATAARSLLAYVRGRDQHLAPVHGPREEAPRDADNLMR